MFKLFDEDNSYYSVAFSPVCSVMIASGGLGVKKLWDIRHVHGTERNSIRYCTMINNFKNFK